MNLPAFLRAFWVRALAVPAACALSSLSLRAELPPADHLAHFITRAGDRLRDGDREFRYISVNMPDSLQIISDYRFDGDYPATRYRLPDEYELRDCVQTVRQLGGRVMRTFVITCHRGESPVHMFDVRSDPVVGHEAALRVIDRLLQLCHEDGVRLIVPLVAYHSEIRGDWSTYGADFWQVGSAANRKFKNMVTQLLGRVNHYTGVAYRDDPAILAWQTGNELVIGDDPARRAWLHDFAAFLKHLDPNHLLIDGRNRPTDVYGHYDEFLADQNLDAVSYHTYRNLPQADTPVGTLRLIRDLTRGKKPLLITEIAMYTPPAVLRGFLDAIIADPAVSGANFWGVRFHNRDGGFYKHSDRNSEFEDLNWPGFARPPGIPSLPAAIDTERELLDIITEHAWKIRGLPVPAPAAPAAPHLLRIPDAGHISWQGSTGADRYTLQRADAPAGPWTTLAADVPDNLIVYAPQYCDRTAAPGHDCYYRVLAANSAGASPPSNVIGPVKSNDHWLVDELFDLKLAAPESRNLRIDDAYAHSAYLEDLAVAVRVDPKLPAELVYRTPRALRYFTATVYQAQLTPRVFALGPDGERREIQPEIASYDDGRRRRLTAHLQGDANGLAIELSAQADPRQAIGRVEIATAGTN
ncbi:MAG TPA: hypothetical protein VHE13_00915 [Opitutus sp.]|nr:hypothetical protein [Opitutus sp.]